MDTLRVKLLGSEQTRLSNRRPVDPEAYNLYLRGNHYLSKFTPEGIRKAENYFKQAIARDPNCALAYAGLADLYNALPFFAFLPPRETFPRAKEAAQKAVEIDDTLAEAHSALATGMMYYDWDWQGAEREYRRAIELSPGDPGIRAGHAFLLMLMGRFEEAIAEMELALEDDPFHPGFNYSMGYILHYAGQDDRAISFLQNGIEMEPNQPFGHLYLGLIYLRRAMYKNVLAECEEERAVTRGMDLWADTISGMAYAAIGKEAEARKLLDGLLERSEQAYVPPTSIAWIYFALGEDDEGFAWLEKAREAHDYWLAFVKVAPLIPRLYEDPRYIDLIKKVGLDP